MFDNYQWNNNKLKKKARLYNMFTLATMALVLGALYLWSEYIALVFIGIGMILLVLSWRVQGKDRKLRKRK